MSKIKWVDTNKTLRCTFVTSCLYKRPLSTLTLPVVHIKNSVCVCVWRGYTHFIIYQKQLTFRGKGDISQGTDAFWEMWRRSTLVTGWIGLSRKLTGEVGHGPRACSHVCLDVQSDLKKGFIISEWRKKKPNRISRLNHSICLVSHLACRLLPCSTVRNHSLL